MTRSSSPLSLNSALLTLHYPGSHPTWRMAPTVSGHMEWLLVKTMHAWHWCPSRLCTGAPSVLPIYLIIGLYNHITQVFPMTAKLMTLNYSSLSPSLTAPWLQHASQNVWQTSALGRLPFAWSLTSIRLSSALCQGEIALRWSNWTLSRTSLYLHHQPWETACGTSYSATHRTKVLSCVVSYPSCLCCIRGMG